MAGTTNMQYTPGMQPEYQEKDEWDAMIEEYAPDNQKPPLPPAPCVKVLSNGSIHRWTPQFAQRSDICVCCDEEGNTDPAAWASLGAPHLNMAPAPTQALYPDRNYSGPAPGAVPQVHTAPEVLGVTSPPVPDYTDPQEHGAAMPIPKDVPFKSVSDAAAAAFDTGMKVKFTGF